jgi:diguanylate cyclase (GGDEF)-like protein
MTDVPTRPAGHAATLQQLLYRAHASVAAIAVIMVGTLMLLGGMVALRVYAGENLHLVARSISYTVEAAVVFRDQTAATDAIAQIAETEGLTRVELRVASGQILASWERPRGGIVADIEWRIAGLALSLPVSQPVRHDGALVGEVRVWGPGAILMSFLISSVVGALGCLALSMLIALRVSGHMVDHILVPLRSLTRVTHEVRLQRDFARRAEYSPIVEIDDLGSDFNALLDELQRWHALIERENASLMHQASHDALTGLPNRAFFEVQLERAIIQARGKGGNVAVFFLDGDKFKVINDTLGHAAGDALLVAIAGRLRDQLQAGAVVARLGGDEFAVLIAPLPNPATVTAIADAIIAGQLTPMTLGDGIQVTMAVSIGIAVFPAHAKDAPGLLRAADLAMYEVKRAGRGGWRQPTNPPGGPLVMGALRWPTDRPALTKDSGRDTAHEH